ncbi:hypothetical protein A2U01_0117095, partial [Trifolium medium]|nr:hypothetical protein [Trifolium medium]
MGFSPDGDLSLFGVRPHMGGPRYFRGHRKPGLTCSARFLRFHCSRCCRCLG